MKFEKLIVYLLYSILFAITIIGTSDSKKTSQNNILRESLARVFNRIQKDGFVE